MLLILLVLNAFAANPITYKSYFTDNSFTTSEDWIITPTTSGVYSDCHNTRILGGYNNFGKQAQAKLSLTLPPHYQIRFTLEFWKIDSWDQEILFIQINGFNVHIEKFALEGVQLCGRQDYKYNELKKIIDRTIPHSNQQIEIIIKTSLDELANNESWGIRDFYLYLFECPSDCPQCNYQAFQSWKFINSAIFSELMGVQFDFIITTNGQSNSNSIHSDDYYFDPILAMQEWSGSNLIQLQVDQSTNVQNIYQQISNIIINSFTNRNLVLLLNNQNRYYRQIIQQQQSLLNLDFQLTQCSSTLTISTLQKQYFIENIVFIIGQNCGDGIIQQSEQCDDGNIYAFDGCFNCQFDCMKECLSCIQGICFKCKVGYEYNILYQICEKKLQVRIKTEIFNIQQYNSNEFQCSMNCLQCFFGECQSCQIGYLLFQNECLIIQVQNYCDKLIIPHNDDPEIFYYEYQEGCAQIQNQICINCLNGWVYDYQQQKCELICGDQQIQGNEECDISFKSPQLYDYGCLQCNYQCQSQCLKCEFGKCQQCINGQISNNKCISVCGDGIKVEGEYCDDGNETKYDSCYECQYDCNEQCKVCSQGMCYECNDGYSFSNNKCIKKCGDGILDIAKEQCDDKNELPQDGCYKCIIQDGFYCYHENLKFQFCNRCDDLNCINCQMRNKGIQKCNNCKIGYFIDSYSQCSQCDIICVLCKEKAKQCIEYNYDYYQVKKCNRDQGFYYDFKIRDCISKCGDGYIAGNEKCDDSNNDNYDGCNQSCQVENGFLKQKNNSTLIEEPKLEVQYNQKSNIQFLITSNFSFQVINCSSASIIIEKLESLNYNYTIQSQDSNCNITINYNSTITPNNLIHIFVQYNQEYQMNRLLGGNYQEIIVSPQRQVYVSEEQQQQSEKAAAVSEVAISTVFIIAPITLLFGGFRFIWPILDILNWINNFYFINVNYPENVKLIFKQAQWASFLQFPQISVFNQQWCDYYFQPKQKFQEKDVDPLYFNNIQKVISLLLQILGIKILCSIFRVFIEYIYKIKRQSQNGKKVTIFQMRNLSQIKTQIEKIKKIDEPTFIIMIPNVFQGLYNRCLLFEYFFVANIIKTIQLSFLDFALAILLQLTNQQTSNYLIVKLNIIFAYLSIFLILYLLNLSYKVSQQHVLKLNNNRFQKYFQCFYKGINLESKLAMTYSFISLIRKLLFICSTVLLYDLPLYQTTLCFSSCFINLIILLIENPFENKELYIQNWISDTCISIITAITIFLAFQDKFGNFNDWVVYQLGWVIVGCIILAVISQLIFLIKEFILTLFNNIQSTFKYLREKCK